MKIFGIGLNKTGTTTLGEALRILKLGRHLSVHQPSLEQWHRKKFDPIFRLIDKFDILEDWPWPLMYKELYERYSDSKFILTVRKDPEIWFESICKHTDKKASLRSNLLAYGYSQPQTHKEHFISFYNEHNQNVIAFFAKKAPEKLLVVCWENNDGWNKLCPFLNKPIPADKFPHLNKHSEVIRSGSSVYDLKQKAKKIIRIAYPSFRLGKY